MTVESYVQSLNRPYTKKQTSRGTEIIMNCPFCQDHEKKFAINAETGAYLCFHGKCNANGSFWDFQKKTGGNPMPLDNSINFTKYHKQDYVRPGKGITKPVTTSVLDWLHSRKISDKTISKFKIREGRQGYVAFPYFKNGELLNIKQRSITGKKFENTKGREPSLFNRDNIKPNGEGIWELTIVEGEMDCLAMDTYGIPCVSIPDGASGQKWVEPEWEWLEKFSRINICLDMDEAGVKGKVALNQRLGEERCYEVKLPYKDANECLMKGISADEIIRCIDNSKPFPIEGIKDASEYLDEMLYDLDHPEELVGVETPFKLLTRDLKGFRMSELTVIAGSNHSGKTTYVGQIIVDLISKGFSACIASLEMPPKKTLRWMRIQNSNKWNTDKENTINFINMIAGKLLLFAKIRAITPEVLFTAWRLAAKRYGTKFFVLDNISLIKLKGKNKLDAQTEFMGDLMEFVNEWKCHVFVVSHVRKPSFDDYTSGKSDVEGSGSITDLAHNVIMVKRLEENEPNEVVKEASLKGHKMDNPSTKITIKKCREVGILGSHFLAFNQETKTLSDVIYY